MIAGSRWKDRLSRPTRTLSRRKRAIFSFSAKKVGFMENSVYSILRDKEIVLWGAGNQGCELLKKLLQNGLNGAAIREQNASALKNSPELALYPLHHPKRA
jgi:hypothetical protein